MGVFYFDSSAIVKRYVHEAGTPWVQSLVDPSAGNLIYLARITTVEVTSAVTRRQRATSLSAVQAASILARFRTDMILDYRVLEITVALLSVAEKLAESHGLRAYDAVHLASAVDLNDQRKANGLSALTLVSADQELNTAAMACGLLVENPNLHP